MTKTDSTPDPAELANAWSEIATKSQALLDEFTARQMAGDTRAVAPEEVALMARPFQTFIERVAADPAQLMAAQMKLWQDSMTLWQRMGQKALGVDVEPVAAPAKGDRRFKDDEWDDNPVFDFIKQSYLLTANFIADVTPASEGPKDKRGQQLEFYAQQFVDAISPSNFALSNPTVMRETVESGGENLVNGLRNLLDDLERGKGELRIKMTDLDHFEVGKNVGTSPGKVVFENELMQLIQYTPSTKTVYTRPLLIFPPWINKFYILDLQPANSFIKWAVDRGHTVFVISWVNPNAALADKGFDDYLTDGALAAMGAVETITGTKSVNLIGYCLGGTLLACTLAHLAAKGDTAGKSATYFASLADFEEPGELGVFIDEETLDVIDDRMARDGYLDGATMATAFNSLRSNDLIWSFVINNYLRGKEPFPFDLLYWNSDATRMPHVMHSFYLRKMYLENRLSTPGGIDLAGTPIDLSAIEAPTYIVSPREDHIAPWRSAYVSTQLYGGSVRFILGGSGHIAGIINPPTSGKYSYWTNEELPSDPEAWLAGAEEQEGSWWPDWQQWVRRMSGKRIPARIPGEGALPALEDAPGSYVKVRDAA